MPFVNKTRAMNHLGGDLSGPEPSSSSLRYQAGAGREMSVDHTVCPKYLYNNS